MDIREKIRIRLDELEILLKSGKYQQAEHLIPNITKFISILTEEQRDFINAAKYAVNHNAEWK